MPVWPTRESVWRARSESARAQQDKLHELMATMLLLVLMKHTGARQPHQSWLLTCLEDRRDSRRHVNPPLVEKAASLAQPARFPRLISMPSHIRLIVEAYVMPVSADTESYWNPIGRISEC